MEFGWIVREGRGAGSITIGHLGDTASWRKGMTDRLIIFVQSFERLWAKGSWEDEWKLLGKWIGQHHPFRPPY